MKNIIIALILLISGNVVSQTKGELKKHFEAYYKQMQNQGDVQGVINALTHLDVIEPSQARKDTLAYIYASEGRHLEALNTIGIEKDPNASNMNIEIKAISLKALGNIKLSLEQYELLFKKEPNPYIAYEIADLKLQLKDLSGAESSIEYGLENATDDMKKSYYESQQPYQVSLKAAFVYLKAILTFNKDQDNNIDSAISLLDQALSMDNNFNLAKISKDALENRKKNKE